MNKLWDTRKYMPEKLNRTINYSGLRIDIHPHVHPFICRELRIFCRWLRASYDFPVRVHIYVPNAKKILARDRILCYGTCFVPDDPNDHVSIHIAGGYKDAGTFQDLQNYTWTTLTTLAHELGHYYQYVNQVELTKRGTEWQATYYANQIMNEYYNAEWDSMDENWENV
jgi:hypothetical protein